MDPIDETVVATRELRYSKKGGSERTPLRIVVYRPTLLSSLGPSSHAGSEYAVCRVEFSGIDEPDFVAHGADTLHALALAVDVDPILRAISRRYDLYFVSGEGYFDE